MKLDALSPIAVAAYHDLRRILMDDVAAEFRGTVEIRERHGRHYLYDRYRIGTEVKARYVGEATAELMERVARAEELRAKAKVRQGNRARLARLLRAEGVPSVDVETGALLTAFDRIGLFRLGGTLVGTNAYRLYGPELGLRLPLDQNAQTGDVDVASFQKLSVGVDDTVIEPVAKVLTELDFEPAPTFDGVVWRWHQARHDTLVEFLAPAFGPEEVVTLPALGVSAQALRYLNFLLREPVKVAALYRSGVLVQVPAPERYAVHKLIVADRRKGGPETAKAAKDRAQAAFLIEALAETRPDDLLLAWEDARARGPRWRERLDRTLARMPEARERLLALA